MLLDVTGRLLASHRSTDDALLARRRRSLRFSSVALVVG